MGYLLLLLAIAILNVNSIHGSVLHGSTYRIKNIASGKYLTSFPHNYLPKTGIVIGKVYEEEWRDLTNQLWDAIAMKAASDSQEAQFWLFPKKSVLNELTVMSVQSNTTTYKNFKTLSRTAEVNLSINKNFVNLRPLTADKNSYLIRSIVLDKCYESQGQHANIFVACNAAKPEQQWEFDTIYDD